MGKLIGLAIRAFLTWFINRNDPEMIKFRELKRIKHAKDEQIEEIDKALAGGDTLAIATLWRELQPHESSP